MLTCSVRNRGHDAFIEDYQSLDGAAMLVLGSLLVTDLPFLILLPFDAKHPVCIQSIHVFPV